MADKISMNTKDAVSANFAECFVTLNGTRCSMQNNFRQHCTMRCCLIFSQPIDKHCSLPYNITVLYSNAIF